MRGDIYRPLYLYRGGRLYLCLSYILSLFYSLRFVLAGGLSLYIPPIKRVRKKGQHEGGVLICLIHNCNHRGNGAIRKKDKLIPHHQPTVTLFKTRDVTVHCTYCTLYIFLIALKGTRKQ